MNKEKAIHSFWSSFGLTAYDENSVPDSAVVPYITYQVLIGSFGDRLQMNASLWYRSSDWDDITNKEHQIRDHIGPGGVLISCDEGGFWMTKGSPFSQRMSDEDDSIRRVILSVNIDYLTEN